MPTEPTEDQFRILKELVEAPDPSSGGLSSEQLAARLDMSVAEVRDHVQALVDLGWLDSPP
jgi:DNA-binding IclR family transcriptional regulator